MKRILSLFLAAALALCLCVPALAADFSDVPPSHTFYSAVMDCAGKGIVGGYDDGTFRPANTVTRSNFSVMLSRAFYAADVATNQTIPMYTEQGTFYPNFMALLVHGVYSGTDMASKTQLQNAAIMNTGINRYEMAQMMTNIMKNNGFAASDAEKSAVQSKIADYSAIPSQFRDAVANVYALGIIGGYSDGSFSGSGIMNRGQACVVIYRMMQYSGNTGTTTPSTPVTPAEPAPETPAEPATTTAGTLPDGSEATEANVMLLLEKAYQAKAGTAWGEYHATGTAVPSGYVWPYADGIKSTLYTTITLGSRKGYPNGLPSDVRGGCGGFAAYLSDYVFGQNAAVRETTLDKIRAGDVIVILLNNEITHVEVYCGHSGTGANIYGEYVTAYGVYSANAGAIPTHSSDSSWNPNDGIMQANSTTGKSYVIYTRYPD